MSAGGSSFRELIGGSTTGVVGLINVVIVPLIFALAFAAFIWGIVSYFFLHGDEEAKREEGKKFILWGVIGMAVLFSVWGFVNIMLSTLGISPGA